MAENNKENLSAVLRAEVSPSLKEAYTTWWKSNGFASESDALRWHAPQVTKSNPESQENFTQINRKVKN